MILYVTQGDSGGPLSSVAADDTYTEVGIVSFGNVLCETGPVDGFTRVSKYLDFIASVTGLVL